jgi:hypothetical protein
LLGIQLRSVSVVGVLGLLASLAGGCTVVTNPPSGFVGAEGGGSSSSGGTGSGSSGSGGASSGSSGGGFGGADASACQPASVATYRPPKYVPASGAGQGACLPGAGGDPVQHFYDACLGADASTEACNTFRETYATCASCILTPETADKYGPLIDHGGFVTANVAGCIELAGDQQADASASSLTCASSVQALADCELAACEANCAVHDSASLSAYETCATTAETGGCEAYDTAAACATAVPDASSLGAACLGDFTTFYQTATRYFCGAAPDDGGAVDAGSSKPPADAGAD